MNILNDYKYYLKFNDKLTINDYNNIKKYIKINDYEMNFIDDYLNVNFNNFYDCYCCISCNNCHNCRDLLF